MTTYNTQNPLGSSDPRDLYDNAENLDNLVNGDQPAYNDRLGKSRKSWRGMEDEFAAFIAASGYEFVGDYAAGIEITGYNQVVRDTGGEFWRVSGSTELPYTTTGAGLPEGGAFVAIGDAVLRRELNANTVGQGTDLIAHTGTSDTVTEALDKRTVYVGSVSELEALTLPEGTVVYLTEGGRAGNFVRSNSDHSGALKSDSYSSSSVDTSTNTVYLAGALEDHFAVVTETSVNGLVANKIYWVINRTSTTLQLSEEFNGSPVNLTGTDQIVLTIINDPLKAVYVTKANDPFGTTGAWVRQFSGGVALDYFGASGNGTDDDSQPTQAALNFIRSRGSEGDLTLKGTGVYNLAKTVFFRFGSDRSRFYCLGGAFKKTTPGPMFSAVSANSGDIYFEGTKFESVEGSGCIAFDTDKIIRLHTNACFFRDVDTIWGTENAERNYVQSLRSTNDTVLGGIGYAYDVGTVYDCIWSKLTLEERESGIRFKESGYPVRMAKIEGSVLEGLSGTAIYIGSGAEALTIDGNYFEHIAGSVGNIVFAPGAKVSTCEISNNIFLGTPTATLTHAIIWPVNVLSASSRNNYSRELQLHDVSMLTSSIIFSDGDQNTSSNEWPQATLEKVSLGSQGRYYRVASDGTQTSYFGDITRVYKTFSLGLLANERRTFDLPFNKPDGTKYRFRKDDFISVQIDTPEVTMLNVISFPNPPNYGFRITLENTSASNVTANVNINIIKLPYTVAG